MIKNTIISGIIVTILLILVSFSFLIVKKYSDKKIIANVVENSEAISHSQENNNNIIETSNNENEKVSPSAKLVMTEFYKKCGHTVKNEYKVPSTVVNMTKEKVKNYYNDWDIEYFSNDCIKLYRANDGICKEHYIIKDVNGYINVFIKNENGEEELYRATDIITKYLSENDRLSLSSGVQVIGKDNLESILEDYQ